MKYQLTGYLQAYLEHNGMLNNSMFYLEGFLATNPQMLNYVEGSEQDMRDLIFYCHNKNDRTLFLIDLEKFKPDFEAVVKRNIIYFIQMYAKKVDSIWEQERGEKLVNIESIFKHIVTEYHLEMKDLNLLLNNDTASERIKDWIRKYGNGHNRALLMERTLAKVN
jgi:hypothetical protein